MLQVTTLHGVLIVEDDSLRWLPDTGCEAVSSIFPAAKDVVLDFELLPFKYYGNLSEAWDAPSNFTGGQTDANNTDKGFSALTENSNHQFVSNVSAPTVCCFLCALCLVVCLRCLVVCLLLRLSRSLTQPRPGSLKQTSSSSSSEPLLLRPAQDKTSL
jgi:hypothetical protein